jgi:hypothetical protein
MKKMVKAERALDCVLKRLENKEKGVAVAETTKVVAVEESKTSNTGIGEGERKENPIDEGDLTPPFDFTSKTADPRRRMLDYDSRVTSTLRQKSKKSVTAAASLESLTPPKTESRRPHIPQKQLRYQPNLSKSKKDYDLRTTPNPTKNVKKKVTSVFRAPPKLL